MVLVTVSVNLDGVSIDLEAARINLEHVRINLGGASNDLGNVRMDLGGAWVEMGDVGRLATLGIGSRKVAEAQRFATLRVYCTEDIGEMGDELRFAILRQAQDRQLTGFLSRREKEKKRFATLRFGSRKGAKTQRKFRWF